LRFSAAMCWHSGHLRLVFMDRFAAEWLPEPKILHPHPYLRFDAKYPR